MAAGTRQGCSSSLCNGGATFSWPSFSRRVPLCSACTPGRCGGEEVRRRSQMRRTGKIGCTGMFQFPIVKMGCNWSPSSSYSSSALHLLPTHSPSMPISPSLLIWRDRKEGGLIIQVTVQMASFIYSNKTEPDPTHAHIHSLGLQFIIKQSKKQEEQEDKEEYQEREEGYG